MLSEEREINWEMSDNMEREKNERLTARKIEEEEMKRELTGN